MEDNATQLATQPIDGAENPAPARKKKVRFAEPARKKQAEPETSFQPGDSVLLRVPHFHGYHATVTDLQIDGHFVLRIEEEPSRGVLVAFNEDELVAADAKSLAQGPNDRLAWDYEE